MAETNTLQIKIAKPITKIDFPTIIGLLVAFSLIGAALVFGGSVNSFFNIPAACIVVGGTIAVTSIAYRGEDLSKAWNILKSSLFYKIRNPSVVATQLMDLAVLAKQKGVLAISQNEVQLQKDNYIAFNRDIGWAGTNVIPIKRPLLHRSRHGGCVVDHILWCIIGDGYPCTHGSKIGTQRIIGCDDKRFNFIRLNLNLKIRKSA